MQYKTTTTSFLLWFVFSNKIYYNLNLWWLNSIFCIYLQSTYWIFIKKYHYTYVLKTHSAGERWKMRRFILEQSDDEFYTSHSGLALAGLCINRYSDLSRVIGRKMDSSSDLIYHADLLRSHLGLLCLGKSDNEAIVPMRRGMIISRTHLDSAMFPPRNDFVSVSMKNPRTIWG